MGARLDAAALAAAPATRSRARALADDDLSVDFAALTTPTDRVAIVATEPLTAGEAWQAMAPGELRVFVRRLTCLRG